MNSVVLNGVGFSTMQVCRVTGCTFRQLDYWAHTGLLVPSLAEARGSGTQRRYSRHDVFLARVIYRLFEVGLSSRRLRCCIDAIRAVGATTGFVVYSDDTATVVDADDLVEHLTTQVDPVVLLVSLGAIRAGVDRVIEQQVAS